MNIRRGRSVHVVIVLAVFVLRAIAAAMFAAAAAALVATAATSMVADNPPQWLHSLLTAVVKPGLALGAGAAGFLLLVPSRTELVRQLAADRETNLSAPMVFGFVGLTLVAAVQLPAAVTWCNANLSLLRDLTGNRWDPTGFDMIPAAVLLSPPAVALAALAAFALTSLLAVAVPGPLVSRVLSACVTLQGGLVVGVNVTERAVREMAATIHHFVIASGDSAMTARLEEWLSRYDVAAAAFGPRLIWIIGAHVLAAVVVSRSLSRRGYTADPADFPVASGRAISPQPTPLVSGPPHSTDFDEFSSYSVRPRHPWLDVFAWSRSEYDIASIPPMSRARFSFSWRSRTIRREPAGPDLFRVTAADGSLFGRRSYVVADARTGSAIGRLSPAGEDWDVRNAAGQSIAHVLMTGINTFIGKAGTEDVCRFVYGFPGLTPLGAELQIEFLPGSETRIDRALAIALGPLLEHRARRTAQRRAG